jgi:hypothetical protein
VIVLDKSRQEKSPGDTWNRSQSPDVFLVQSSLAAHHFGHNARRAENVTIFLQ